MEKKYFNYHSHRDTSNPTIADSPVTVMDYIERAKELGHTAISCVEHGVAYVWERTYLACEKHNMKFIYGVEGYILHTDDKVYHIILLAKNKTGMEDINELISEACISNFKNRRPRITLESLAQYVNPENVICTTACTFGILNESTLELFEGLRKFFKNNFYLEVQPHNTDKQIQMNLIAKKLSEKYGIKLIGGNDSHYIYPHQKEERDDLIYSKRKIRYDDDDEDGWYMDYPDYNTMFQRFMDQGIWTEQEVSDLIERTNMVDEWDNIVICKDLRVPTLYPELTPEERKKKFAHLIDRKWDEYKEKNVPLERRDEYIREIITEMKEWFNCDMEDYALTVYEILVGGVERGGVITTTGRGSCSSFITNMLLGFTTVDRLQAKVPILMPRFMTADKVKRGHTTPDIDNNVADITPFVEEQVKRLGENCTAPLIACGTVQESSGFRMMCKARGDIPMEIQDEMSKRIKQYQKDKLYADDEDKDNIKLEDYLEGELLELYKQGEKYFGIITDIKRHASAFCISNINLKREFGYCRTPRGDIVLNLEGQYMDTFGLVKIDWLIVDVVKIIDLVYKEIGIPTPSAQELYKLVEGDKKTWDIYHNGLTCCVNQCEKAKTKQKVMKFRPMTVEELCAFIASIRPGFITYYNRFESRVPFSYKLTELDAILQGKHLDNSYLLYQEQIMLILMWLDFDMKVTYDVMKAISKKKEDVINSTKETFFNKCVIAFQNNGFNEEDAINETHHIWDVIINSSKYSFNASHSYCMAFDSLYIAYAKAHYPSKAYQKLIDYYSTNKVRDKVYTLQIESERLGYDVRSLRFGQDNRGTVCTGNIIFNSLSSVKGLNDNDAIAMYEVSKLDHHNNFLEVMLESQARGVDLGKIKALIYIGYFDSFGKRAKLLWIANNFKLYKQPKINTLKKMYDENSQFFNCSYEEFVIKVRNGAERVTEKTFFFDNDPKKLFTILEKCVTIDEIAELEKKYREVCLLGTLADRYEDSGMYEVINYNEQKKYVILRDVVNGEQEFYKLYSHQYLREGDIVYIPAIEEKKWKDKITKYVKTTTNLTAIFN